jgi:hypothetical protein
MSFGKAKFSRVYERCGFRAVTKLVGYSLFSLSAAMQDLDFRLRALVALFVGLVVFISVFSYGNWFP